MDETEDRARNGAASNDSELTRPVAGEVEERTAGGVEIEGKKIRGVIPFGTRSVDMGGWFEQVEPTAFRDTRFDELRCVIDHRGVPLGRFPTTLTVAERPDGLHWSLDPPRSRADVIEAVERGDMRAGSWRMVVARDRWDGDVRHVESIAELLDVTLVGAERPAYPAAAVEYRSQPPNQEAVGPEVTDMAETADNQQQEQGREQAEDRAHAPGGLNVEDRVEVTPTRRPLFEEISIAAREVSVGEVRSLTTAVSLSNPEYSTQFFDVLRPQSAFLRSGVRTLTTQSDTVIYPVLTGDPAIGWVAEGGTIAASDPGLGSGTAVPHKLAVRTEYSNELVEDSSPGVEQIFRQVLVARAAVNVDSAAFEGTGLAPQPFGMGLVSGIGNVNASTAASSITWAGSAVAALEAGYAPRPYVYVGGTSLAKDLRQVRGGTANDAYLFPVGSEDMPTIYGASGYVAPALNGGTAYFYAPSCCYLISRTQQFDVEVNRARLFDSDRSEMRLRARLDYFFPFPQAIVRGTAVP